MMMAMRMSPPTMQRAMIPPMVSKERSDMVFTALLYHGRAVVRESILQKEKDGVWLGFHHFKVTSAGLFLMGGRA